MADECLRVRLSKGRSITSASVPASISGPSPCSCMLFDLKRLIRFQRVPSVPSPAVSLETSLYNLGSAENGLLDRVFCRLEIAGPLEVNRFPVVFVLGLDSLFWARRLAPGADCPLPIVNGHYQPCFSRKWCLPIVCS